MLQSWSCVGAASATFKKKNLAQRHSICLAQDSSPVEGQMRRLTVRASRRCNFYRLDLSKQQPRDLKFSVEQSFFFIDVKICQEVDIEMVDVGISLGGVGGRRHM